MARHLHWYAKFPGDFYALDWSPGKSSILDEIKQDIRKRWKLNRLPNGTEIWPKTDEAWRHSPKDYFRDL